MKKITQPHPASPEEMVFAESIDYFQVGEDSLWGHGDAVTLQFLESTRLYGDWLDLAAGDGRYAFHLLKQVDRLFTADIDCGALSKLWFRSPIELNHKLHLLRIDIKKPLPFASGVLDGVFCTGILHLFPEDMLFQIAREIDRVVRPGGRVVFDFATDIERCSGEGFKLSRPGEPQYTLDTASMLLRCLFAGYCSQQWRSIFEDDLTGIPQHEYISRGKFILFAAEKPG